MRVLIAAAVSLCACAGAKMETKPPLPANLAVPAGAALKLTAYAKGTQNYTCQAKAGDAGAFVWAFTAPEADLFDEAGKKSGTHYAGPTWESTDGSKIVGAVTEKAPSPDSIPWLLLTVKSSDGQGVLTGITHIQRIQTAGGNPPEGGCDAAGAGQVQKAPYTATYLFYGAQ